MRKHYREIDILKGLAIAMVIFGHSIIVFPINLNLIRPYGFFHRLMSSAHMPLFFLVSGFCFYFTNWKEHLVKKAKRILIPYVVFELLILVANLFASEYINNSTDIKGSVIAVLTGENYWFLYTLMIIFIVFPPIRRLFENRVVGAISLIVICALGMLPFIPYRANLANAAKYLLYFSLGYYLKLRFEENEQSCIVLAKRIATVPTWLIGFACWTALAYAMYKRSFPIPRIPLLAVNIVTALLGIFTVSVFAVLIRRIRISKLFEEAGKYSLQLYLFNGFLLTLTRILLINVLHITSPIVIIAVIFSVSFFLSLAVIKFVVKPVKLFRVLCGMV